MANERQSPCLTCTKVKDPPNCENKLCKDWKAWFLRRWAEIYGYSRRYNCGERKDNGML